MLIVPLPAVPPAGETVHQSLLSSTLAVQAALVSNVIDNVPPSDETTGNISVPGENVI